VKDDFLDRIVDDLLKRQPSAGTVSLNRPNYQREKARERMAAEKKAVASGDLFALSMKPGPPGGAGIRVEKALDPAVKGMPRMKEMGSPAGAEKIRGHASFLGTAAGATLGYVIPNLSEPLRGCLGASSSPSFRAVGVLSSRQGAVAQIMAADEAVKMTNAELIHLQLARDEMGGPGHGIFVVFGADDVADVMRAVEVGLSATDAFQKNVMTRPAGKVETHYSARASAALKRIFDAPLDRACGVIVGAPAGLGLLLGDTALKTAAVDLIAFRGPSTEQAFANEVWLAVTGDPASVTSVLESARALGVRLLDEMGT
jgi:ethanolamine utilization microcompartment shell protein EutL